MKKIYALTVVCLCFAFTAMSQTFYWVGSANGSWNSSANWSASSGGAGGAGVPNSTSANVIFNSPASVNLGIDVNVNTLTISNSSTVRITASGVTNRTLTVNSTSAGAPGLLINAGCRLEDSTEADTYFEFIFAADAKGTINGQWYLTGFDGDSPSYITLPQGASQTTKVNINNNASITVTGNAFMPINTDNAKPYLSFNSGSFLYFTGDGCIVPKATYNANSTISITGIQNVGVVIDEKTDLGNLVYNCPNQASDQNLGLLGSINIDGDFQVQNTNNFNLILIGNTAFADPVIATVKGNLDISGNSSVMVSKINASAKTVNFYINGNLTAGGNKFDLQGYNSATLPTVVFLKGNLQHTAGTFGASSTAVNESQALFVVEMNGTSQQTISSVTGSIDNAGHQVSLRMNNANGAKLNSPLSVGRIDFATANKGKLTTTSSNVLTIQNTSNHNIVVNSPGNAGYVDGPVRRISVSTTPIVLPTGAGSLYKELTITPASASATTYEAMQTGSGAPGGPVSPLTGIADYYWTVSRPSGTADATVQIRLNGSVPGAVAGDGLTVAKYDGANWAIAMGSTGTPLTPGNTSSGVVISELQSNFTMYTIGYGTSSALPINLVSFTGKRDGTTAVLAWKITENSTPVHFEVLRSNDGKNFIGIGTAAVTAGRQNYSFTDLSMLNGNNYYRLKMFDKDGSVSYSNIIVVMNGSKGIVISSMIPTLVRDRARLNISSSVKGNVQLVVTDITGRVIQTQNAELNTGSQEIWLNAGRLAPGMFQVTGYINGERTATIRFIKQ